MWNRTYISKLENLAGGERKRVCIMCIRIRGSSLRLDDDEAQMNLGVIPLSLLGTYRYLDYTVECTGFSLARGGRFSPRPFRSISSLEGSVYRGTLYRVAERDRREA